MPQAGHENALVKLAKKMPGTTILRFVETLTGTPHQYKTSETVSRAAESLKASANHVADCLRPYTEADDPITAMMLDIFNAREMRRSGNGSNHGPRTSR